MKLALGIFVLLTAFCLSVVAAWFSIIGMVALFAASATGVIAMMVCLEFGKLVASGVLKMNWSNPNFNKLIKSYLFVSVGVLMLITSIGIYGYLSAGHLEQKAPLAGLNVQSQQLDVKVAQRMDENTRIEKRLDQIDKNIGVFLENDKATQGLSASNRLSSERTKLQAKMDANNEEINKLNEELVPLKMQTSEVEAKLGPVKYVAALFGWTDTESAVRLVILILMVAFDPLAVVLMLAGLIIMREWYDGRNPPVPVEPTPTPDPVLEVPTEEVEEEIVEDSGNNLDDRSIEPDHTPIAFSEVIDRQTDTIERLREEINSSNASIAEKEGRIESLNNMFDNLVTNSDERIEMLNQEINRWKDIAGSEFERARALSQTEPVRVVDRESLLKLLEENPSIINEIEEIIETDMTDRQKLLDLLERDPTLINDIAEVIASQVSGVTKPNSWLG